MLEKVESGSAGAIYNCKSGRFEKTYHVKVQEDNGKATLQAEKRMYDAVNIHNNIVGFPRVHKLYSDNGKLWLVMEKLGRSLREIHQQRGNFSEETMLLIAIQSVKRLRVLHEAGYVHRLIRPSNLLVGRGEDKRTIFLHDMGIAKRFRDHDRKHIPFKKGKKLVGTYKFASKEAHYGYEQSRRDDMWALGYSLVFLATGQLPWSGLEVSQVLKKKEETSVRELCGSLPSSFDKYFEHISKLEFTDRPDYSRLVRGFEASLKNRGGGGEIMFDWLK